MRFGASQRTRALRPPQMVLPKKLDLRRPLPQSLWVKACGSRSSDHGFVDGSPAACARNVHSFGNAVSRTHTSPPSAALTGAALTSNAAQVAGLGRIYFGCRWPRNFQHKSIKKPIKGMGVRMDVRVSTTVLIFRLLFSILTSSKMLESLFAF